MKSKILFWILVIIVFGSLFTVGLLLQDGEPKIFWLIEGCALVALLLFITLYRQLIKPYQILLNGIDLIKGQDFSSRLRSGQNHEANKLIDVFNKMMDQLKQERLQVREKNQFLDLLINASPQGVIILDFDDKITELNPAAMQLLKITNVELVKGKRFGELSFNLVQDLAKLKKGDEIVVRSASSAFRCVRSSFIDFGFDHPFILIEELTHELIKIEKESYEGIIRLLSHEVNNSVGAIGSTLNVVSDILHQEKDEKWVDVLPAIDASFQRCGHLAQFISNFANVVKIPEPSVSDISLNELLWTVEALTRLECQRRNIKLELKAMETDRRIFIDGILFEQVLVNIIKNAYEAIGKNGEIRIISSDSPVSITIMNNGPDIPKEVSQKLFTPFFTTKATGQGIGLMLIREILTKHKCKFNLSSENGWTKFEILF